MKQLTKVVFRLDPKGAFDKPEVVAWFPYDPGSSDPYTCSIYVHHGQHGIGQARLCSVGSRPATVEEYQPLLKELKSIGYRLHPIKRFSHSAALNSRKKQIKG